MSSAILYLAIVAIWAIVLVPRWLRPRAASPQPVPVPAEPVPGEPMSAEAAEPEPVSPGQGDAPVWTAGAPDAAGDQVPPGRPAGMDPPGPDTVAETGIAAEVDAEAGAPADEDEQDTEAPGSPPATRRAEVLKARRRLLTTLLTLTSIAVALVVTRIDAYWIVIPPAALLGGYLVLLRKLAKLDAERERRAARIRHATTRAQSSQEPDSPELAGPAREPGTSPGPLTAPPAAPEAGAEPGVSVAHAVAHGAEIIDISGRIGDQVYDQYSDAAHRAVGD